MVCHIIVAVSKLKHLAFLLKAQVLQVQTIIFFPDEYNGTSSYLAASALTSSYDRLK